MKSKWLLSLQINCIHDIFHLDASRETNSRLLGNFHFCCCSNSHSGEIRSKVQFHLVMSLIKVLHCSDLSTFGQLLRIHGLKKFLNSSFSVLFFFSNLSSWRVLHRSFQGPKKLLQLSQPHLWWKSASQGYCIFILQIYYINNGFSQILWELGDRMSK